MMIVIKIYLASEVNYFNLKIKITIYFSHYFWTDLTNMNPNAQILLTGKTLSERLSSRESNQHPLLFIILIFATYNNLERNSDFILTGNESIISVIVENCWHIIHIKYQRNLILY